MHVLMHSEQARLCTRTKDEGGTEAAMLRFSIGLLLLLHHPLGMQLGGS